MSKRIKRTQERVEMIFTKQNYLMLIIGLALIFVGFVIMRIENQVDGFWSLYICPFLIVGGFVEIVFAILKRDDPALTEESSS